MRILNACKMVDGTHVLGALRFPMRKSMLEIAYWLNTGSLPIDEIHSDSGCSLEDEDHELALGQEENKEDESPLVPEQVEKLSANSGTSIPQLHTKLCGPNECKNHNHINVSQTSSEDTAAYILANNYITKKRDSMMIVEGSKVVHHFEHPILKHGVNNDHGNKTQADNDHVSPSCEKIVLKRTVLSHKGSMNTEECVNQNKRKSLPVDSNNLNSFIENGSDESIFKSRFLNESSPLCRNSSQLRKKKLFLNPGSPIEFSPASEVESQTMKVIRTSKNIEHPALTSPAVYSKTPLSLRRSSLSWKRKCAVGITRPFSNLTRKMYSGNLSKIHEHGEGENFLKVPVSNPVIQDQVVETDRISLLNSKSKDFRGQTQSCGHKGFATRDSELGPMINPNKIENNIEEQEPSNTNSIKMNSKGSSIDKREFRSNNVIVSHNEELHNIKNHSDFLAKKNSQRTSIVSHLDVSSEFDILLDEPLQDSILNDSQSRPKKRNHSKFILISSSDESEILKPVKKKNSRKSVKHKNSKRESNCLKMTLTTKNSSYRKKCVQSSKLVVTSSSDESDPPVASRNQDLNDQLKKQNSSLESTCDDKDGLLNSNLGQFSKNPVQLNRLKSLKCEKLTNVKRSVKVPNSSSDEEIFTPKLKEVQEKALGELENGSMIPSKIEIVGSSVKEDNESENKEISLSLAGPSPSEEMSDEEDIFTPSFRICLKTDG